jgi:hypothetical protein
VHFTLKVRPARSPLQETWVPSAVVAPMLRWLPEILADVEWVPSSHVNDAEHPVWVTVQLVVVAHVPASAQVPAKESQLSFPAVGSAPTHPLPATATHSPRVTHFQRPFMFDSLF